jgi:hypothetical protein
MSYAELLTLLQNGQVVGTMALPTGMNAMASSPTWSDKQRSVVLCCSDRIILMRI